jgi:hypothetical protein
MRFYLNFCNTGLRMNIMFTSSSKNIFVICCLFLINFININSQNFTFANSSIVADLQIDCICKAKWNFDGSLLAISAGSDIQIWDSDSWKLLLTITEAYADYDIAWHPNKNQIATVHGGKQEGIMIWDANTGEVVRKLSRPYQPQNGGLAILRALVWSPDGNKIATDSDGVDSLLIWDLASDSLPNVLIANQFPQKPYYRVEDLKWSNNGQMLLSSGSDEILNAGTIPVMRIWDIKNNDLIRTIYGSGAIQWGLDDTQIASIYNGEIIAIWDVKTGEIVKYASTPGNTNLFLSWNKSANLIASMDVNDNVNIWNVTSDGLFIVGHTTFSEGKSIDWKPQSTQLAIAGKGGVKIWDYQ